MKYLLHADDFGRSVSINSSIKKLIKKKKLNSVSIIVCQSGYKDALKIIKKEFKDKINIRLHLNLTDGKSINKNKIYNYSFFKLLLLPYLPSYKNEKKFIKGEILKQIRIYKDDFNLKSISIDGHQHIHMIPWIFNIIFMNRNKYNIRYIRKPREYFYVSEIKDIFKLEYLINILKFIILKVLDKYLEKKINKFSYKYSFSGILYTGINTLESVKKSIKIANKKNLKYLEILFHPGKCSESEKKLFSKSFYKYYFSNQRIVEQNILKNLKLNSK